MGNIISPTPGDYIDRQTILQVKLEHCGVESSTGYTPVSEQLLEQSPQKSVSRTKLLDKTAIDIQPTILEHEAIQERLQTDWYTKLTEAQGDTCYELEKKLKSVNAELWRLEDMARVLRISPDRNTELILRRKSEVLDGITISNDKRMELVKQINSLWGISIQEKVYQ